MERNEKRNKINSKEKYTVKIKIGTNNREY